MADVLEYLLSHAVSAEDTFQLPQDESVRRAYANSGSAVDRAAVLVTEGGGARACFAKEKSSKAAGSKE